MWWEDAAELVQGWRDLKSGKASPAAAAPWKLGSLAAMTCSDAMDDVCDVIIIVVHLTCRPRVVVRSQLRLRFAGWLLSIVVRFERCRKFGCYPLVWPPLAGWRG